MKKRLFWYFLGLAGILVLGVVIRLAVLSLFIVIGFFEGVNGWEIGRDAIAGGILGTGKIEGGCLAIYAFAIAVFRSHHCPGHFKLKYREWLKTSPWVIDKPLPWGDFRISFAELGILLGIEVLLVFYVDWPFGIAVYAFSLCYFGLLFLQSFSIANTWREFFASGFLLALPLVFVDYFAWIVCPVFVGCWALSNNAARRSWKYWVGLDEKSLNESIAGWSHPQVGWPWGEAGEVKEAWADPHPFLLSVLVLVWFYALGHHWPGSESVSLMKSWFFLVSCISLSRIGAYVSVGSSPLSIWGRIRTGRMILPGHDKIFIAPICSMLGGVATLFIVSSLTDIYGIAESIALGVCLYIALRMGPGWKEWKYTGEYRANPPRPSKLDSSKTI